MAVIFPVCSLVLFISPISARAETVITCLGDSVTHGYPYADTNPPQPQYTYPGRMSIRLEDEYGAGNFTVLNHGVNGYRAENVVSDLLQPASLSEDPDYVLLLIGGNDLAQADISTIAAIIEETTWEVQSCVDLIKAHTNADSSHPKVIVSAFIPNLLEETWGTLAISAYNSSLSNNLSGYDLWFTENWDDFYDQSTFRADTSLMSDNVHPNVDGYQVMADNWFEALSVLLPTPVPTATTPTPTVTPTPGITPTPTNTPTLTPSATPIVDGNIPTPSPVSTCGPPVDQPLYNINSGDYDGDGTSDIAIFREGNGLWAVSPTFAI